MAENNGRRCSVCARHYYDEQGFFDLAKCCPRMQPGDTFVIACLLEGVRVRDARIEQLGATLAGDDGPEDSRG